MDHRGRVELVFGHGHRLSVKDLADDIAIGALLQEQIDANQIEANAVSNSTLARVLNTLLQKVNIVMADLDALKTADANIQASVNAAATELQTLADRLAAASANNDQAGIDAVTTDLQTAATNLATAVSSATTETTTPSPAAAPADTTVTTAADQPAGQPTDQAVPAGPTVADTPTPATPDTAPADTTQTGV